MTEEEKQEAFVDRWSRLKREQPTQPADKAVPAEAKEKPVAPLPPVEDLKPDSDFAPFMNPNVDPATRRNALKKLFTDAHYNVPDPFEAYSEDYTKSEPIPEKILKAINRIRDVAIKGEESVAEEERLAEAARAAAEKTDGAKADATTQETRDVPGRQDA